jgi:hypothetical protein
MAHEISVDPPYAARYEQTIKRLFYTQTAQAG